MVDSGKIISIHRRHVQRDTTSYVGIIVFVASWAMMFAALFMSYAVLRIRSTTWPPAGFSPLPLGLPFAATLVLGLSSFALQRGLNCVRRGYPERYLGHLIATFVLGAMFLALQCTAWVSLWRDGLQLRGGIYGGIFYLLTCFHALHVLVGLILLGWLFPGARRSVELGGKAGRLGVVTIYWHFVGVVWGIMFVVLYLA